MPQPGVLILLYHRVANPGPDPQRLAVRPDHFATHLDRIRRDAEVLSLAEVQAARQDRRLPRRGVAITFDDGYADNATAAAPLLRHGGLPATFFVTTSCIDGTREFWWDELEQWFLGPGELPRTVRLTMGGRIWSADLGDAATWSARDALAHQDWTIDDRDPTPRHAAYRHLCSALKPLTGSARRRVLDDLAAHAGRQPYVRDTHRAMTAQQIAALAAERTISVGSHTVTHPSLGALPISEQRPELQESRATLSAITAQPVTLLAYPFGGRADHSWRTRRAARAAGYQVACVNEPGLVRTRTNLFRFPRVLVRDWDGPSFSRQLERWFDG